MKKKAFVRVFHLSLEMEMSGVKSLLDSWVETWEANKMVHLAFKVIWKS